MSVVGMTGILRTAMRSMYAAVLVLLAGCTTGKESFSILDLSTGARASIRKASAFPDEIIGQNAATKTIRLFTRVKGGRFQIRDVRYDGSVTRQLNVPCFNSLHLQTYALGMYDLAVAEDARHIAYFNEHTKELRLFEVSGQSHQVLMTNLASGISMLQWHSENELLACIGKRSFGPAWIVMLDVRSKALLFDFHTKASLFYEFSPNRRFIAYSDLLRQGSYETAFRIYDLLLRRVSGVITSTEGCLYGSPLWTENSDGVIYADLNRLMMYSVKDNKSECLREYEPGAHISPRASAGGKVFYTVTPQRQRPIRGVYVYDRDKKREVLLSEVKSNGQVIASPDGRYLITGWGQ